MTYFLEKIICHYIDKVCQIETKIFLETFYIFIFYLISMPDKKTHLPYERWQYDPDNETTDPIEGQSSTLIETPDIHIVSVQKQLLHPVSKFLNTQVKPAIDALRGNSKTDLVQSYESDFWVQAANVRGRPSPPVRKGPPPAPAKAPPPAAVKDNKPAPADKKELKPPKAPKVPKPPKQDFTDWNPTENVSFPVEQKDLDWFRRCLRKGIYISCILHLVSLVSRENHTTYNINTIF